MKVMLAHFSDIHFVDRINPIVNKVDSLSGIINNTSEDAEYIIFLITGDIAYSGTHDEYNAAKQWFDCLLDKCNSKVRENIYFATTPGNHDCYHKDKHESVRSAVISTIQRKGEILIDKGVLDVCCKVQSAYRDFESQYVDDSTVVFQDPLLTVYKFSLMSSSISVFSINTSPDYLRV